MFNSEKSNCSIIIDPKYKGSVILYNEPSGSVLKKIQHNFSNEDYVVLDIIGKNDSMFYVNANFSIKGLICKGWVKKDNPVLGIYSKAYNGNLKLYEKPGINSKINCIVKKYTPQLYHVIDCQKNWLLVYIEVYGKKYKGWMDPTMQCDNPYSTCN